MLHTAVAAAHGLGWSQLVVPAPPHVQHTSTAKPYILPTVLRGHNAAPRRNSNRTRCKGRGTDRFGMTHFLSSIVSRRAARVRVESTVVRSCHRTRIGRHTWTRNKQDSSVTLYRLKPVSYALWEVSPVHFGGALLASARIWGTLTVRA